MSNSESPHKRLDVLDGLRALAIALVVARHSLRPFWEDLSQPFLPLGNIDLGAIFLNGWCGVDLFFVLSGFLITRQLLDGLRDKRQTTGGAVAFFLKKRFFRIAPAYYVVLTILATGILWPYPTIPQEEVWGWTYIYHLLFLDDYLPSSIMPGFWSLAVEMKFYLVAPLLIILLLKIKNPPARFALLGVLVFCAVAVKFLWVHWYGNMEDYAAYVPAMRKPFHLTLDGLLAGVICAFIWDDKKSREFVERPLVANLLFATGACTVLILITPGLLWDDRVSFWDKTLLLPVLAAAFACMMLGLLGGCSGHRIFTAKPLKALAALSYSLYLVHMPLVFAAISISEKYLMDYNNNALFWSVFLLPYLLLCLIFSTILHFAVEKPFIAWSRKK